MLSSTSVALTSESRLQSPPVIPLLNGAVQGLCTNAVHGRLQGIFSEEAPMPTGYEAAIDRLYDVAVVAKWIKWAWWAQVAQTLMGWEEAS